MTRSARSGRLSPGANGFSLVEAVMAIAVFAVVGTAVGGSSVAALRALTAAHADMLYTSNLCVLERTLRTRVSAVRYPFWHPEIGAVDPDAPLSLPWLDGDPDKRLEISFADGRLTVAARSPDAEEPVFLRTFPGFSQVEWTTLRSGPEDNRSDDGKPVGTVFTLVPEAYPEKTIVIKVRFGGLPLTEEKE